MNIVITLPLPLIQAIMEGRKTYEMRKAIPKHLKVGEDGFFCVEKGSKRVLCWCRVDKFLILNPFKKVDSYLVDNLCVSADWITQYREGSAFKDIKLWKIGKVISFKEPLLIDKDLLVDRAPQSFAYTTLSYGESY